MKNTLSISVYNEPGVLARITRFFSSRGFNIDSLTVGPTENNKVSRIIIIIPGDYQIIEQITKQLNKLIQVIEVKDLTSTLCIQRELMLIKIKLTSPSLLSKIWKIAQIFKAEVVDISNFSITLEVTGDSIKIKAIQELLRHYEILEIVRTGNISIQR
jgi:acetolactate synthase-1/3 small subunit